MNKSDCPIAVLNDKELLGLNELKGAKIIDIGFFDPDQYDGRNIEGGLVIDYTKDTDPNVNRIILGFTELGMWVDWKGQKNHKSPKDELLERMIPFYKECISVKFKDIKVLVDHEDNINILKNATIVLTLSAKDFKTIGWPDEQIIEIKNSKSLLLEQLLLWVECHADCDLNKI